MDSINLNNNHFLEATYIVSRIATNVLFFTFICFVLYYLVNIGNKHIDGIKKISVNRKHLTLVLLLALLGLLIYLVYNYREVLFSNLKPVFWAIIIAYLLNPVVHKLMSFKISRLLSVTIIYVSIFAILAIFTVTITPRITSEIKELVDILPTYTNETFNFIDNIYDRYVMGMDNLPPEFVGVEVALRDYLNRTQIYIIDFFRRLTEKGLDFFSHIVSLVLIPIYAFYFLKDSGFFKRKVILAIPTKIRNEVICMGKDIDKLLSKFIRGQLIIAGIVGILSIIALLILDINFAFLIGTIAGLTNVIPYFGPVIGGIPAVIVALLDEPIKALWVVIAFFIIQQLESAVLSPKIVGDSVGLHPVFVIITLLIGGELFGLVGLLFAIPVAGSLKIIINHIAKSLNKVY